MTAEEFAALVLAQQKARIAAQYSQRQADAETVQVIPGPKYTKVDLGPAHNMSGKFMIENATGVIYGIKGYGRVHKGHMYGTLDTTASWDWSGYGPERRRCSCGKPGALMLDPYAQDVNNEEVWVVLCDDCAQERSDDI